MRNNRQHIYLMPGLGANSLIFEYLDFPKEKYSIHLLDWIMPIKNESIENYCSRFSKSMAFSFLLTQIEKSKRSITLCFPNK